MSRPPIAVLVLAYCKSPDMYRMTMDCLQSLHASEADIDFEVVLVETASPEELQRVSGGRRFQGLCRVVHPGKPFHYNDFLQEGYRALQHARLEFESLLIVNNDVLFEPGFATALAGGLSEFDSVSPWCPGYHEALFPHSQRYYEGLRTTQELCGWAFLMRREVLETIGFERLFPRDFAFWFQDNYYAHQLQLHGFRHALVRAARVRHLFQQSHSLILPERREEFTTGAHAVFQQACQQTVEDRHAPLAPTRTVSKVRPSRKQNLGILGFLHLEKTEGWESIWEEQCILLEHSGLLEKSDGLVLCVAGEPPETLSFRGSYPEKWVIRSHESDLGEAGALRIVQELSQEHDGAIYYVPALGAGWPCPQSMDWRHLVNHFLIERHEECLRALDRYDVCGVNLRPEPLPHFAGNGWWARASHLRQLPKLDAFFEPSLSIYGDPELVGSAWVASLDTAKTCCVHESGVNHLWETYPYSVYRD